MREQNPYMNLYRSRMIGMDESVSKEYLLGLAVNLGHVHNLLGVMIGDVVRFMGGMSLTPIRTDNKHSSQHHIQLNQHKPNPNHTNPNTHTFIQQKMQIENLPIDQFDDRIKSEPLVKKECLFDEFGFNQQKKKSTTISVNLKKQIVKNGLLGRDMCEVSEERMKREVKQEDYQEYSKTQSKEKVRYGERYENQFHREQVNNLYYQKGQVEPKVNYEVNIKKVQKHQKRKSKSPFFDLFDSSSQTSSNPIQDQHNILQKLSPISQQKPFNERLYQQTQLNEKPSSSNFLKPKPAGYSSQLNNDKIPLLPATNKQHVKPYNLLQETFVVGNSKLNALQVEEIDDLESSSQKVSSKVMIKRKPEQKKDSYSYDEYIPRRQEIGRKKSTRQIAKGSQCPDCKAFYEAVSDDSKSFRDMCECTSRHKSSTTFMKKHQVQNYSQAFSLN